MSLDQQASENLQIIRSLMERSTIYRAISAPTAFVGGVTSIFMGLIGEKLIHLLMSGTLFSSYDFFISWGIVICVTIGTHLFQLYRDSLRNGEPIFSSRHFHAFKCMFPSIFTGGAITFCGILAIHPDSSCHPNDNGEGVLVITWTFFYGLALLSTQTFSPSSIQVLGWIFFVTGFLEIYFIGIPVSADAANTILPSHAMALTFGLFHLIYAIAVKVTEAKQAPEPGFP